MIEWYVQLPSQIQPVAFSVGGFGIRWYTLSYFVGFFAIGGFVWWQVRKGEIKISLENLWDIGIFIFFGGVVGGRVGWLLLYGNSASVREFFSLLLPFDRQTHVWTGWYGMSFFGALIGGALFAIGASRLKKISFLVMADAIVPAVPLGIFFGRIGNFCNGELFGKVTESGWGMNVAGTMRHPSQWYEAVLEGLILFLFLRIFRKRNFFPGAMLPLFGMGYGAMRFVAEFFRDESLYAWVLTQGQLYALILFAGCSGWMWWGMKKYDKLT